MNYLTGKQIELRAVEPEDLDALYRWEMIRPCGYTEVPYRPSHVIC